MRVEGEAVAVGDAIRAPGAESFSVDIIEFEIASSEVSSKKSE